MSRTTKNYKNAKVTITYADLSVEDIDNIAFETAESVRLQAQQTVPVVTGNLLMSIKTVKVAPMRYQIQAGGPEVEYAGKIEFGGSRKVPEGYLRPAILLAPKILSAEVLKYIERGFKSLW